VHRSLWLALLACDPSVDPPLPSPDLPVWHTTASSIPTSDGFDFPVGPPDADGYYDAQPFGGPSSHLGSDWNGNGGGDSDLGDPIHSIGHGLVTDAFDRGGGWGGVVMVAHRIPDPDGGPDQLVESLYAHLQRIDVKVGDTVARGALLGTMGNVDGLYLAHLHFEIRSRTGVGLGGGYGLPGTTWVDPTAFIEARRPATR